MSRRHQSAARVPDVADLEAARRSQSGVEVLRGEPGIGKSSLLAFAADQAGDMPLLRATGVQTEVALPFAALHELLYPVLNRLQVLPAPQAAALGGAFGSAPGRGDDRFLVAVAVLSLLAEVAGDTGMVCLVDDAQWVDQASSEALVFAARRLHAEGVVMLFAARDGEPQEFRATIVRAVLLPATMKLLGDWNWYLPRWLDWLPHLEHGGSVEPIDSTVKPEPRVAPSAPKPTPPELEPIA